jgi:hypothetical protein
MAAAALISAITWTLVAQHLLTDRDDHGSEITIGLRILFAEALRDRPHVRVCGLDSHGWLQASDHLQEVVAARGGLLG